MKIQALDIQIGECILAYCNQKMQACKVRQILELGQDNITLLVSISGHYRSSVSRVVRFKGDTLVEIASSKSTIKT